MGLPASLAGVVARGADNQLRKIDYRQAIQALAVVIPRIAKQYGAREDIQDDGTLKECQLITLSQFGHLGPEELVEAYRLWAAGKIQALEMYGGRFNATQWARVLAAYDEHRKKIWAQLEKAKDAEREAAAAEKKQEEAAEFRAQFPAYLDRQMTSRPEKYQSWRDVPEFWYEPALAHGLIAWEPGEPAQRFAAALEQADADAAKKLSKELGAFRRMTLQHMLADTRESRARVIARKRATWDKIVTKYINGKEE